MRAIEPVRRGFAANPIDGGRVHYEVFGSDAAGRAIVFSPVGSYNHGRVWKGQVSWFAKRGFRVVSWDGRGSGRSDRPSSGYSPDHFAGDLLAVMEAAGIERAALVGHHLGDPLDEPRRRPVSRAHHASGQRQLLSGAFGA